MTKMDTSFLDFPPASALAACMPPLLLLAVLVFAVAAWRKVWSPAPAPTAGPPRAFRRPPSRVAQRNGADRTHRRGHGHDRRNGHRALARRRPARPRGLQGRPGREGRPGARAHRSAHLPGAARAGAGAKGQGPGHAGQRTGRPEALRRPDQGRRDQPADARHAEGPGQPAAGGAQERRRAGALRAGATRLHHHYRPHQRAHRRTAGRPRQHRACDRCQRPAGHQPD